MQVLWNHLNSVFIACCAPATIFNGAGITTDEVARCLLWARLFRRHVRNSEWDDYRFPTQEKRGNAALHIEIQTKRGETSVGPVAESHTVLYIGSLQAEARFLPRSSNVDN